MSPLADSDPFALPTRDVWAQGVDQQRQGVWRYHKLIAPALPDSALVDLGDTWAPIRRLSPPPDLSWVRAIWVQREDLNPNGSHKDRSLAVQVSVHWASGAREFCISSSGNAAIAAAAACRVVGAAVHVFLSPQTPPGKREAVARYGARIVESGRAATECAEFAAAHNLVNLRPSTDDAALLGYQALAFAHAERGPADADSIFIYSTSGSTLCGMARGFQRLAEFGWTHPMPSLHAAQAGLAAQAAQAFGDAPPPEQAERSVIGDLGAKRSRRHGELMRALRRSGGGAWWCANEEILAAHEWLLGQGVHVSLESACATAAALKAARNGRVLAPLIVATGHYGHDLRPLRS